LVCWLVAKAIDFCFIAQRAFGHYQQQIIKTCSNIIISSRSGMKGAPAEHLGASAAKTVDAFCTGGGCYFLDGRIERFLLGRSKMIKCVLH